MKSVFQVLRDWIASWDFPEWLHEFLDKLFKKVVLPTLQVLGEEMVMFLEKKIVEASKHTDWSGRKKFEWVASEFRDVYIDSDIADRVLNLGIEILFNKLKTEGFIR